MKRYIWTVNFKQFQDVELHSITTFSNFSTIIASISSNIRTKTKQK